MVEKVTTLLHKEQLTPRPLTATYTTREFLDCAGEILPPTGTLLALDTETTGLDAAAPEFDVVGIGLAWREACIYISTTDTDQTDRDDLCRLLSSYKLIAHNIAYDAAVMARFCAIVELDWTYCTYGLYRQIASEGYPDFRWGLKPAMTQLLGWPEQNDTLLNEWLVANGHTVRTKADKSKMCLAPVEILAPYCATDADACWQLYHLFDRQVLVEPEFAGLRTYHTEIFIPSVMLVVEQQLRGLYIDSEMLTRHKDKLESDLEEKASKFLSHPEVAPFIRKYNIQAVDDIRQLEPNKLTKTGKISKSWDRWRIRLLNALDIQHFNINSKQQLVWLFFDCVGYKPIKFTDSGARSVDKKSLPFFGEPGKILIEHNALKKELGYVATCLATLRDDILYPRMRCPGTVTGRMAGSG